ncbi:MAG: hypothetical protein J0H10_14895 [Alphaproteobacteria bacterium]|mgnify:FL=1|nr:hypothetical protein [Alphaproteobacteria bacterium]
MFVRLLTRRIATLVLALGVFLGAAAPSWAVPGMAGDDAMPGGMAMMMPDMAMQNCCNPTAERGTPNKNAPCKNTDGGCALCTACALPIALLPEASLAELLYRSAETVLTHNVNRNGIATPPALPPPIA